MSKTSSLEDQGFINFPRQKLSDAQKTNAWYKRNIDYAENLLTSDLENGLFSSKFLILL